MVNYDVFISSRGTDTSLNLAKYLYKRLTSAGITVFRDRVEIQYGDDVRSEFLEAIGHCNICVPIFSLDFASSIACLEEVAKMAELHKKEEIKIRPIFFFVEPKVVKFQRGTYATSFKAHEAKGCFAKTIPEWKKALKEIGGILGPEFKNAALKAVLEAALKKIGDGVRKGPENTKADLEAALAETGGPFYDELLEGFKKMDAFICDIWKLSREIAEEDVTQNLVGIKRDVRKMMEKLGFYYKNGVPKERAITERRVLVVWGMPGVGKTTLARVVFHKIKHLFQRSRGGCSFLKDVRHEYARDRGVSLQNKLIRELKGGGLCPEVTSPDDDTRAIPKMFREERVLIVLDDVDVADDDVEDQFKQIKQLAEKLTWFGEGSVIILTTTKKRVIDFYRNQGPEQNQGNVVNDHEVLPMNQKHARELFYKHAFPRDQPRKFHKNCSRDITRAVGYLPYAIKIVGDYLCGKNDKHWEETSNGFGSRPEDDIIEILKKHLDSLSGRQNARNIFLDIACFFTGVEKTIPYYMWAALGWKPRRNVDHLENMSLLRMGEENEFTITNQLKLLGKQIVMEEGPENPEERSRLWDQEDVRKTLSENKGTKKVQALRVASSSNLDSNQVDDAVIASLSSLRFLELDDINMSGNGNDILPRLKWLDWRGCKYIRKLFAFHMKDLVILNLCSSADPLTLQEWDHLMMKAVSLQVLSLKDCTWVMASMQIPASSHLKCLILEDCLHLELNTSFKFENLVSLNMKDCKSVKVLPEALRFMRALKKLLVDGTKIKELQFKKGSLPALETLSACHCEELHEVTDSIGFLNNLKKLFLRGCKELNTLPRVFGELGQLQEMDLSDTSISELPPCVKHCEKLQVLKMAGTPVEAFPKAIKALKELKELDFTCANLSGSCDITGLFSLRILRLKGTEISEVLARDEAQFCLHILELDRGVTKWIRIGQSEDMETSVSKLKRKRQTQTSQELGQSEDLEPSVSELKRKRRTQTSQENSCVSQSKRNRS